MGMRNPFELMKSLERFRSCWLMPTRYKKGVESFIAYLQTEARQSHYA